MGILLRLCIVILVAQFTFSCSHQNSGDKTTTETTEAKPAFETSTIAPEVMAESSPPPPAENEPNSGQVLRLPEQTLEQPISDRNTTSDRNTKTAQTVNPSPDEPGLRALPTSKAPLQSWKRSRIPENTSRLMIGDKEEIPLKAVQTNIKIEGYRARIITDYYYYNQNRHAYEGKFQMRLPNGASPYFLAFGGMVLTGEFDFANPVFMSPEAAAKLGDSPKDIMQARKDAWTQPKQAVMALREKAALAYEETVKHRIDPALMEWSGAGVFSARLYPLSPGKLHRVVIAYEVDLEKLGDDLYFQFLAPDPAHADLVHSVVDLSINGFESSGMEIHKDGKQISEPGGFHRFTNVARSKISVRIKNTPSVIMASPASDDIHYFSALIKPPLAGELSAARGGLSADEAVFLVDVSLSANPDQFNIYLKLLNAILVNNRDDIKKFAVLFFNVETFWWKKSFVANTDKNTTALMAYANQLALEGATDIHAALNEATHPAWEKKQTNRPFFLLSDGSATWGESNLYQLSQALGANTLFTYSTGLPGTDLQALNHLARESGGSVFTVAGETEIEQASRAHRFVAWRIESVRIEGGTDLIMAGRPAYLYPGQILKIGGRGSIKARARLEMVLSRGNAVKTIHSGFHAHVRSNLAKRAYGLIAVGQLESLTFATETTAQSYARYFRVPGNTASLLMLDNQSDYLRFNITAEEDLYVIKSRSVAKYMRQVLEEMLAQLKSPKRRFIAWFEKIQKLPSVNFKASNPLKIVVEKLPEKSFIIKPKAIHANFHQKTYGKTISDMLETRQLDYDRLHEHAGKLLKDRGPGQALKLVSSLVENRPGDFVLAQDIAMSTSQWNFPGHAYQLYRKVAEARPHQAHVYRAMAGLLDRAGYYDLAAVYYEITLNSPWPAANTGSDFYRIVAMDYLSMLRKIKNKKHKTAIATFLRLREKTLSKKFRPGNSDLVISISWNTDNSDVDLHVTEPGGEKCSYKHPRTKQGGRITTDIRNGFGPEMYAIDKAPRGTYQVAVKYFQKDRNLASARTKVFVTAYRNWGSKNEKFFQRTVILEDDLKIHPVLNLRL